jgi:hypothetical protein
LVSYSDTYTDYLSALGMPAFVVSLMKSVREVITFKQPEEEHGLWTMITKTGEHF